MRSTCNCYYHSEKNPRRLEPNKKLTRILQRISDWTFIKIDEFICYRPLISNSFLKVVTWLKSMGNIGHSGIVIISSHTVWFSARLVRFSFHVIPLTSGYYLVLVSHKLPRLLWRPDDIAGILFGVSGLCITLIMVPPWSSYLNCQII